MNSLVTGSNGFIGSHLVEMLLQKNHDVTCLIRKTSNLQWIHKLPVHFLYGDVTDFDSLKPVVKGKDYIFHLGGSLRSKTEQGFYRVNYNGTLNLLNACKQNPVPLKKFIYVSSQAAAGPAPTTVPLKESDTPQPISRYGKSKLKAEQAVQNFNCHFPITIIRPPAVYGPHDDDILEIFKFVKWGIKPIIGKNDKFISLIHIKDLINGILLTIDNSTANGQTYFLANDPIYSIIEIQSEIEKTMHKRAIKIRVPEVLLDIYAFLSEFFSKLTNTIALVNRDKALELKQQFWLVDNSKAKHELGFVPEISLSEGIKQTYNWYRKQGWL